MYPGSAEHPGPQQSATSYAVVVEEKHRRTGSWHISLIQPAGGDLAAARTFGQNTAFSHQPQTAGSERDRDVYQLGADSWLVTYKAPWRMGLKGPVAHFRVSVIRHVGSIT